MNGKLIAIFALLLVVLVGILPLDAIAQTHEYGSCWIEQADLDDTILHADGDPLCTLEFPSDCFGGMMSPDAILCILEDLPEDMLPEDIAHGLHCVVEDDQGSDMMNGGHMMGMGFFQRSVVLTVEYDLDRIASMGMRPEDLVLVIEEDGQYRVMDQAIHDLSTHRFSLSTNELADWYGVADGSRLLVGTENSSWGGLKANF